ncbi:MAG: hypothetical protein GHCLOJNM_00193 [bacterium]|nr:hypothetical protein [bacterium]
MVANLSDDQLLPPSVPHLSYSQANKYLTCPEQYRLYYLEGLRPKREGASLVFGKLIHQALAVLFQENGDPVKYFQDAWDCTEEQDLRFAFREKRETLRERGTLLLEKFVSEELPKIGTVHDSEREFTLTLSNLDLPFVGFLDLVADLDGKRTVIDFKTSGSSYEGHEALLSDQLTAYQCAEPFAEQSALLVFVKTKEPKIEWHLSSRTGPQLREYLEKLGLIAQEIHDRRFYKRPGQHCAWCDFLAVCTGDRKRVEETLVRV